MRKNKGFVLTKLLPLILLLGVVVITAILLGTRTGWFNRASELPATSPTNPPICNSITASPNGSKVTPGQNVRLEAIVSDGIPPYTFYWSQESNGDIGSFSNKNNNPNLWTPPPTLFLGQIWNISFDIVDSQGAKSQTCSIQLSYESVTPTPSPYPSNLSWSTDYVKATLNKQINPSGVIMAPGFYLSNNGSNATGWSLVDNQQSTFTAPGGQPVPVKTLDFGFYDKGGSINPNDKTLIRVYASDKKANGRYIGSATLYEARPGGNYPQATIGYDLTVTGQNPTPTPTPIPQPKIVNNSFEIDSNSNLLPDNWITKRLQTGDQMVSGKSYSGTYSFKFLASPNGSKKLLKQTLSYNGSAKQAVTFAMHSKTTNTLNGIAGGILRLNNTDGTFSETAFSIPKGVHNWTKDQISVVSSKPYSSITVSVYNQNTAASVWFDETSLTIQPAQPGQQTTPPNISASELNSLLSDM